MSEDKGTRLAKYLAQAGKGSRRACEELIRQGRVDVDHETVFDLGRRVLEEMEVRLDGERVKLDRPVYFVLNKPRGVVCTSADDETRERAIDLVDSRIRVYPVGRLDEESEGLLLLTNDGEMAHALTHPSFGIRKVYRVKVRGRVSRETMEQIREGVHLAEGKTAPAEIHVKRRGARMTALEMILREGMNREVRRVFARFDHPVYQLKRVRFGPIALGRLPGGASRPLRAKEIRDLKAEVERAEERKERHKGKQRPPRRPAQRPRGPRKPGTPRPKAGKPKTGKPERGRPESGKPKTGKPKPGKPGSAGKPKARKPKGGEPKSRKPKGGKPRSGKPRSGKPRSGKPKARKSKRKR